MLTSLDDFFKLVSSSPWDGTLSHEAPSYGWQWLDSVSENYYPPATPIQTSLAQQYSHDQGRVAAFVGIHSLIDFNAF